MFLQRISFDITINPVKLSGGIRVSAGPRLFGTEAVSVDGSFTYENANPDRYVINGSARIVDIPLASGSVSYQTDGRLDMSAQAAFSKLGVGFDGSLQGWVDGANAFNFQGAGGVHLGRSAVAATRWSPPRGSRRAATAAARMSDSAGAGPGPNDQHIFATHATSASGGRPLEPPGRASDVRQLRDRGGKPVAVFSVVGTLAPPRAILTGPDGATVAATPDDPSGGIDDGRVLLFQNPEDLTTYIALKDPAGGLYRLSLKAGSAPGERLPLGAVARRPARAGPGRPRQGPTAGAALDLHRRARALGGVLRAGP